MYLKMLRVSCTNTRHDVTDLVNHGIVKNEKYEYLENNFSTRSNGVANSTSQLFLLSFIITVS